MRRASALNIRARSRSPKGTPMLARRLIAAAVSSLAFAACASVHPPNETAGSVSGTGGSAYVDQCSGNSPEHGCDDCNPCTVDVYCVSCADVDGGPCAQPEDLPPYCAGKLGCSHYNRTTPTGQTNDCFPVAGSEPPEAGECFDGVCK